MIKSGFQNSDSIKKRAQTSGEAAMLREIKKLADLLRENVRQYEDLEKIQKREWELCSRFVYGEYKECLEQKENLIQKIQALEQSRLKSLKKLARLTGISDPELTLSRLSALVAEPERSELLRIKDRLARLIHSTADQNRQIYELLLSSMELSRQSLVFLQRQIDPNQTYSHNGRMARESHHTRFTERSA
jgi:flagellar biosynthesis/type III secretory pathway chaperone